MFLIGFSAFCGGIASWSVAAAGFAGGAILMTAAVYPYVYRRKE